MRLPRLFRTTSFRLTLLYVSAYTVSVTVLFAIIYWSTAGYLSRQLDASTDMELASLLDGEPGAGLAHLRNAVEERARGAPAGFFYLLQDHEGKVLAGNLPPRPPQAGIVETVEPTLFETGTEPHGIRGRGVPTVDGSFLFVASDNFQIEEMQELIQRAFGLALGVTLVLGLGGGAFISASLLRRVEVVSRTSREIVGGNLDRRMPVNGSGDEFDHLSVSLNTMLDRIGELMEGFRQVSNDIAHDLRTPLSRLRQRLERARRRTTTVEALQETVDGAIQNIDEILDIFGALLRIAQIEGGSRRPSFAKVDIGELMASMGEIYQPVAEERAQKLSYAVEQGLVISGDRELLVQMFSNLVENAIRHSPDGAAISLEATRANGRVQMIVRDSGPGIPPEFYHRVFQRFFRLEESRTTPGDGLGLSLVAAVAALHAIEVTLGDNRPGLVVSLRQTAS